MAEEQSLRISPQSELDLNLLLTDSTWGKEMISKELKDRLSTNIVQKDKKGNVFFIKDAEGKIIPYIKASCIWGELDYFTRDLRLGNLSQEELYVARYILELAGDCLEAGLINSFRVLIARVATITELSQSKDGFLRQLANTLIQKLTQNTTEPQKKGIFGKINT